MLENALLFSTRGARLQTNIVRVQLKVNWYCKFNLRIGLNFELAL